jgi:NADH-quinone oxidoreductase subunit F
LFAGSVEVLMSDHPFDLTALQPILARHAAQGRAALLPALLDAQAAFGHIPAPVAQAIARALHVPLADLYGVLDFYTMLYREPAGRRFVRVCDDPSCRVAGSAAVLEAACARLGVRPGETASGGDVTLERVPCLGLCEHAPAALVDHTPLARISPERLDDLLAGRGDDPHGVIGGTLSVLTARCGAVDPRSLDDYRQLGGYAALRKTLPHATPAQVIAEIKASGLVGRGGAAFPTGAKWEGAAQAGAQLGRPVQVVCNADESEPGTFSNRVLLEEDPYAIIEAMTLCGYAVGSRQGWLYVRGEYPRAQAIVAEALAQAAAAGLLGANILGSGFEFHIELRSGAGAYICGEETALFESIEGKRGFPRIKPPFPTVSGLFGQPTVINNVETFANVPHILMRGAAWFRSLGTERSAGSKLFCLSGHVARPGVYEAPFGITLGELLALAGGVTGNLRAVLIGGAAGTFLGPDALDMPLSNEGAQARGAALGSGAIMVFNDGVDLRALLALLARFFAHESCGKCFPCQLGTQRQMEILERAAAGQAHAGDAARLHDLCATMTDTSLCGLGQTAGLATASALRLWPDLVPV